MDIKTHLFSNRDFNEPLPYGGNQTEFPLAAMPRSSDGTMEPQQVEAQIICNDDVATGPTSDAVMRLQKAYRGYRTRRMLADSAVIVEELWWQLLDFARLNRSTISFFNFFKPETVPSRWNRVSLNASKVGKGLSEDAGAQKLAFQHWIEAIDPRHRYGHGLHYYFNEWCTASSGQPFFYWLDVGDGKDLDLNEWPRSKLRQQCIKYLGPNEREHYEYIVVDGKLTHKLSGEHLDTRHGPSSVSKWIFVLSTSKKLYAGKKKKGVFHHSSFLAGGATLASGRLDVESGVLKCISGYSGHYRPTEESLDDFSSFLKENGVNLDEVQIFKGTEEYESNENCNEPVFSEDPTPQPAPCDLPCDEEDHPFHVETKECKGSLSGGLQSPKPEVPESEIKLRISSKNTVKSYQLGHQVSIRWSTGAGPRIGCVADYPLELRLQALELANLSQRTTTIIGSCMHTP